MNSNILVSSVFANIRYYALRDNGLALSLYFFYYGDGGSMEVVKSLKPKEEEMIIIKKYQELMLYVYNLVKQ